MLSKNKIEEMQADIKKECDTTDWTHHRNSLCYCLCILDKILGD